jgi:hypothetical protein
LQYINIYHEKNKEEFSKKIRKSFCKMREASNMFGRSTLSGGFYYGEGFTASLKKHQDFIVFSSRDICKTKIVAKILHQPI